MPSGDLVRSDLLRGREIPDALLHDLAKADLHVHLDGSLRLQTYADLAAERGVPLPGGSVEAARELLTRPRAGAELADYIALFDHPLKVLQDAEALRRVAREIVEDCAAENVWHLELRFSPPLHREQGLSDEEATLAVLAGLEEASAATGVSAGLIFAGVRHRPVEETLHLAELAVAYKGRGVIGFDLAGVEPHHPADHFVDAFHLIRTHNVNCTVHAGEAWGPDSIRQALHDLVAHRISHATRLFEDADLAAYVADHRIPIEIGLTSATRTGALAPGQVHPLRRFLAAGIRVALTTNNRLLLDTDLTRELRRAVDTFDLTLLEIENLVISSFKSAFLPQAERGRLVRRAVDRFAHVRRAHGLEVAE